MRGTELSGENPGGRLGCMETVVLIKSTGWGCCRKEGNTNQEPLNLFLGWHALWPQMTSSWVIWVGPLLGDMDCQMVTSCFSILPVFPN